MDRKVIELHPDIALESLKSLVKKIEKKGVDWVICTYREEDDVKYITIPVQDMELVQARLNSSAHFIDHALYDPFDEDEEA